MGSGKLGAPKAITAMAHMLARLVYRMLKFGHDYLDRGVQFYEANTNTNNYNESENKPPRSICNSFLSRRLSVKFLESCPLRGHHALQRAN